MLKTNQCLLIEIKKIYIIEYLQAVYLHNQILLSNTKEWTPNTLNEWILKCNDLV